MNSESLEQHKIGHFGFTAVRPDKLGAAEYTLVTLVCDRSGSTAGFQQDMEAALQEVIKSCQMSPRADNLLLRTLVFEDNVEELHGFKPLENINTGDYAGSLRPGGTTALFDAMCNGVEATLAYGEQLDAQDFACNAVIFFMTDGLDNRSTNTKNQVREALQKAVRQEALESLVTVLIGVAVADQTVANQLATIQQDCGLTQFVALSDANKKTLAKLAQFVSQSISSQSSALGSGGPSQPIQF